jgi:putative transposase
LRCRDLLRQTCNALDVRMLKGVVSKDHIHLPVSSPPSLALSALMRRLKGRSAKLLLQAFPELKRRYGGGISGASGTVPGAWAVSRTSYWRRT